MKKIYTLLLLFISLFITAQTDEAGGTPVKELTPIHRTDVPQGVIAGRSSLPQTQSLTPGVPTGSSVEVGVTAGQLSVSLTGGANYTIPINVPPGIHGMVPQIGLMYDSQSGNGIAGYGWNFTGLSRIKRIASTKHHDGTIDAVDFDVSDRFALDGQRLIVKDGVSVYGANGTVYETEKFSNLKITSYGVSPFGSTYGPEYFIVEYPDGSKAYYGNSPDSRSYTDWGLTYHENPQGARISYTYTTASNQNYFNLSSIKYGSLGTASAINEVRFEYQSNNRMEEAYIGGKQFYRYALIKKIDVIGNGLNYRTYELNYDYTTLKYNRLISVTEKSGTKSLNPTVFSYDNTPEAIQYIPTPTSLSVNNISYLNTVSVPGDFNGDGKMDFILYPTTGIDAKKKYWLFDDIQSGSNNIGQEHAIGSFVDIFPVSWLGGSAAMGYKLMPAQGWSVIKTNLTTNTTTFSCYSKGTVSPVYFQYDKSYQFPKFVYGYLKEPCGSLKGADLNNKTEPLPDDPVEPIWVEIVKDIPKIYLNGDFNGDGLTDAVAVQKPLSYTVTQGCSTNTYTYSGGKTFFVDLDRRLTTNYVNVAGTMSTTADSKFNVVDYDGDGKADILVFDAGKMSVYSLNDTKQFVLKFTYSDSSINISAPILLGDYNGDGKADFMIPNGYGNSFSKYTATGTSYLKSVHTYDIPYMESLVINNNDASQIFHIIPNDFNADGKTDLILVKNQGYYSRNEAFISVRYFRNFDGGFVSDAYVTTENQTTISQYALPVFLNFDSGAGNLDINFISKSGIFNFKSLKSNDEDTKLRKITLGNGVVEAITYAPLSASQYNMGSYDDVYTHSVNTENYPNSDLIAVPKLKVVSRLEKQSYAEYVKQDYKYFGATYNVEGLGFLGFRSTATTNWYNDDFPILSNVKKFDITKRGVLAESYTLLGNYQPSSSLSPTTFISKSIHTNQDTLLPNKVYKVSNTNTVVYNGLEGTSKETTTVYNNLNNPDSIIETYRQGASQHKQEKTFLTYDTPQDSPYVAGRISNKKTESHGLNQMDTEEVYEYYSNQLLKKLQKKGHNTNVITEDYIYNPVGNLTKKTISTPGITSREVNFEYDATERFLKKSIDVEGLVSQYTHDFSTGDLLSETLPSDPNYPLKTSYEYDVWGKKKLETDYLGNSKTYSYSWLAPGVNGYSSASVSATDGSYSVGFFDDLGRVIADGTRTINDFSLSTPNVSWKSYETDIYGRVIKAYEPGLAILPLTTGVYSTMTYDSYGRITEKVEHTGKRTTINYLGLTTTVTDGVKTEIITKDAVGNIISKSDNGNVISYQYYANGNLKQSDFNGNIVSIIQDGWGRKTRLEDPSAGQYDYSYNEFGELLTETSLNGVTTYILDTFGKLEEKTIVGTNTNSKVTYTYDSITKLPIQSRYDDFLSSTFTNFTYKYDNYRRLNFSDESGFLAYYQQATHYDSFGRPERQLYTSMANGKRSDRWIKNTYKNGYLWQISDDTYLNSNSIASNPVLWQADLVNARGQLLNTTLSNGTAIVNIYDQYGFSTQINHEKTGLTPVNILTLNTAFTPARSNLESRSNSMFNSNETFTYDYFDRLTEWGDYILPLYNDNFAVGTGDFPPRYGATAINDNGKLKVSATTAYSGVSKVLLNKAKVGDKIKVAVKVDKGTTDKVRVLIVERNATGQWNQSFKGYAQNGDISFEHDVTQYEFVDLIIDKDGEGNDVGTTTNFYVDDLEVTQTIREKQHYDDRGRITQNNLGVYNYNDTSTPSKVYRNTSLTINPTSYAYYNGREGVFNDDLEGNSGWVIYEPSVISYDDSRSHTGIKSLKINNPLTTEKVVHSDVWLPIHNTADTQYTYSAWVYSEDPQAELYLFMKTETETGYFTLVDQVVSNTTDGWVYVEKTFLVPANIKKLNIRLDNNGTGNIWFDDVRIKKTGNTATSLRELNIAYNTFKAPFQIEETGVDKISFDYNAFNGRTSVFYGGLQSDKYQRQLRKHYSVDGTMEIKHNIDTGETEFITYIGGDGYSAPVVLKSDGTTQEYLYLHRDYQGSILAITNQTGNVVEKRLFDPWGNIVQVQDGQGNTLAGLTVLDRGYTGHEHLQSVGLVHMNGRLYDPKLHRFLQPDNYIQDPYNTQNYNRYAYVLNNPMRYADYNGEEGEDVVAGGGGPSYVEGGVYGNIFGSLAQSLGGISQGWDSLGMKDFFNDNVSNGFKSGGNWLTDNLKSMNGWFDTNIGSIGDWLFGKGSEGPRTISTPQFSNVQSGGGWQNQGYQYSTSNAVIQMPTQHSFMGINMTSLSEGGFVKQSLYGLANNVLNIPAQYMMGRSVADGSMRNLNGTPTSTDQGVLAFGSMPLNFIGGSVGNRALNFDLQKGFGLFGKNGLKILGSKIEAFYRNPSMPGAGTYFSIKQTKNGGFLFRIDKGLKHGTEDMTIHMTYRFRWFGEQIGSTKTQWVIYKFFQ